MAGWLLDSDHPPATFIQLTDLYLEGIQDTAHTVSRANAYSRAITDLYKLVKVYDSMRSVLVKENMFELFSGLESSVAPILAVMETEGLGVERETITEMRRVLGEEIACIEREAHCMVDGPFQLTSPAQVSSIPNIKYRLFVSFCLFVCLFIHN